MEYTKEELKEFDRLTRMGSSLDQMDRIKSRLSVDDALDTVANVWKEKAGEDIMWHWDDSSWGWRPRFGASCDK